MDMNLTDLEVDALFWSLRQPNQVRGKLKPALKRASLKIEREKSRRRRDMIYQSGFDLGKKGKDFDSGSLGCMETHTKRLGFEAGKKHENS